MGNYDEYDFIVIGGGPNGLGIAAYLAKAGYKVCVLEEKLQVGGAAENVEPIPGIRIDPHATYFYALASPAIQQLELHKFGLRLKFFKTLSGAITSDGKAVIAGRFNLEGTIKSVKRFSEKDAKIIEYLYTNFQEKTKDFLRAIFWTPPFKGDIEDMPWLQFAKLIIPDVKALKDFSTFEILDALFETEPLKVQMALGAWYNGPFPGWKGMGIFGIATGLLMAYSSSSPQGGMHSYIHSILRCALHHGAKVLTNSPVSEIIIENGEAKGVVLGDKSLWPGKELYAKRAVISAVDVKQTFLKLVKKGVDISLLEKIKEISLNGGSLFVLHLVVEELPKYKDEILYENGNYPTVVVIPGDSREYILNQARDVFALKTHPIKDESMFIMVCCHTIYRRDGHSNYYVLSPIYVQVSPPEYHKDGPMAVNKAKEEIAEKMIEILTKFAPNIKGKIVAKFINTPLDSEFRNQGLIGGNWYAIRECEDQWWGTRPIPELAYYRTPIPRLYLCHQTSYPGGLCLLAVPYNLFHILIEDGMVSPPDWWEPSPYLRR